MSRTISTNSAGITLTAEDNPVSVTTAGTITGTGSAQGIYGPGGSGHTWTVNNAGHISSELQDGIQFGQYGGTKTVSPAVVVNASSGVITGYYGVYVFGSGTVTNQAGGSIAGTGSTSAGIEFRHGLGTVVNSGSITGGYGVYEGFGGTVTNQSSGLITAVDQAGVGIFAPGTVVNAGTITGGGPASTFVGATPSASAESISAPGSVGTDPPVTSSDGVYQVAGTLTNSGTITGGAGQTNGGQFANPGDGGGTGVNLLTGTLTNFAGGTIAGGAGGNSGGIYHGNGGAGGIGVDLTTVTLTNAGTLVGGNGGTGGYNGNSLAGGNAGAGGNAVDLRQGGSLVNNALIAGGNGGAADSYPSIFGNGGNGGGGVDLAVGGTLTNNAVITGGHGGSGSSYSPGGTGGFGVYVGTGAALANSGTITGGNSGSFGAAAGGAGVTLMGSATLTNTGTIIGGNGNVLNGGDGVFIASNGVVSNAGTGVVMGGSSGNGIDRLLSGTIAIIGTVTGGTAGTAGVLLRQGGALSNTGSIAGHDGVDLGNNGGSVTNQTSASITGAAAGIAISGGIGNVVNAGSVRGGSYGVKEIAGGSLTNQVGGAITATTDAGAFFTGGSGSVVNYGSIGGAQFGVLQLAGGTLTNKSGGSISGGTNAVYVRGNSGSVVNYGSLHGGQNGILEKAGGTITNHAGGIISSTSFDAIDIAGGVGNVVNSGSMLGTAYGVSVNDGGSVTNSVSAVVSASTGTGIYVGQGTSDTVVNDGRVLAGKYGVSIYVYYGDTGALTNAAGATISGAGYGIAAYGAIAITNSGKVAGLNVGLSTRYDDLAITNALSGTIAGTGDSGTGVVISHGGGTLVNAGTVSGERDGVYGKEATSVTNQVSGLITGSSYQGIYMNGADDTVVNYGRVLSPHNGVSLLHGGFVTNAAGGTIAGTAYSAVFAGYGNGTVVNSGVLLSGTLPAVYAYNGGTVTNQQGGVITGGVDFQHVNTTVAAARPPIASYGGDGQVPHDYPKPIPEPGSPVPVYHASVVNSGTIQTTNRAAVEAIGMIAYITNFSTATIAGSTGVEMTSGLLNNAGSILAGTSIGVLLLQNGLVVNTGVIASGIGTPASTASIGISLAAAGTVINSGTIAGGLHNSSYLNAVQFGTAAGTLVVAPSAVFKGDIVGNSAYVDVVHLASAVSAGTLSGFGTSIINLGSLVFDSGSQWTVGGNDSASGLGTLGISGFALGDTIDLTGFVAAGKTFSSNLLTLSNSLTQQATLSVLGGFVTADFLINPDGNGGTDITLGAEPPAAPVISTIGLADVVKTGHLTITGTTDAGTAVALIFGNEAPVAATVTGTTWSYTLTLADIAALGEGGPRTFTATASDAAGTSPIATSAVFFVAAVPPPAPVIASPASTDVSAPVITGTAEDGATVTVTIAGATYTTVATGGVWSINLASAVPATGVLALNEEGANSVSATATDAAGVISTPATQSLLIDTATPVVTGTLANQGTPNEVPVHPFANTSVLDADGTPTLTVTVTLSVPGNGTLSNLSGGTYNATTGVYSVTGTPSVATTALRALVFTPIAQPGVYVTTTGFSINPGGGGPVDAVTTVTSVQQILGLAAVPLNQIVISVSPDGSSFAPAQPNKTNEAVVRSPVENGSYTVPAGYQALYLGGTADATLTDAAVGNAYLVANSGGDDLIANAPNDVLVAGAGGDSLVGGSFASTVAGGAGSATVFASIGAMQVVQGTGSLIFAGNNNAGSSVFGGTGSTGGSLSADLTGANQTASVGSSAATLTVSGSGGNVIGGTSTLAVTVSGTANTIQGGSGTNTAVLGGSGNQIIGGSVSGAGALQVFETGSNNTIFGGAGSVSVTVSGSTQVVGGSGSLQFIGGTGVSSVFGGTGGASVSAGAGGVVFALTSSINASANSGTGAITVFGASGASINLTGSSGQDYLVAGAGTETINASGASSSDWLSVATTVTSSSAMLVAGSGNDTLIAGSALGSTTMTGGSGVDAFVFFKQAVGGANDVITNFAVRDGVYIEGYATSASASTLLSAATAGPGGLTLALSDGTTITFSNLTTGTALDGRIQYG